MSDGEDTIVTPRAEVTMDGDGGDNDEVTDVSYMEAVTVLDKAVEDGEVDRERAERLKLKFKELNDAYVKTCQNQKKYFRKWKSLKQQQQAQQLQMSKAGTASFDDKSEKGQLTRELLKWRMEQELAQGRLHQLLIEKEQMEIAYQEHLDDREERMEAARARLLPEINAAHAKTAMLTAQLAESMEKEKSKRREKQEIQDKQRELIQQREHLMGERRRQKHIETKKRDEIANINKEIEVFESIAEDMKDQHARELSIIRDYDNEIKKTTADINGVREAMEKQKARRNKIKEEVEDVEAKCLKTELAEKEVKDRNRMLNARQVEFQNDILRLSIQVQRETKTLAGLERESSDLRKAHAKLIRDIKLMRDSMPMLKHDVAVLQRRLADEQAVVAELTQRAAEVQKDEKVKTYLQVVLERKGEARAAEVEAIMNENAEFEAELREAQTKDKRLHSEINSLTIAREHAARECTKMTKKLTVAKEAVQRADMVARDYNKQLAEVQHQLRECDKLYNQVKNERNMHVNSLQQSQQHAAEFKEKLKILANEIEILRAEIAAKEKEYVAQNLAYKDKCAQRDAVRMEVNEHLYKYGTMRDVIDQQLGEIERLNTIINQAESEMLKLKSSYETAVEDRNYTGIQLIDRNDELCILYEKANIQERFLRQGEITTKQKEEVERSYRLRVADLLRKIELYEPRASRRELEEVQNEVMLLTFQLESEQAIAEKLEKDLEDPKKEERYRLIEGDDDDAEDLYKKVKVLEQRLNEKEEELLEKTLVLDEVTNLSDRLRKQAGESRHDTLELAKKVNDFQARIRDVTRRMMATVSELTMYQATAMKLEQEKIERETQVKEAEVRLEQGLPPTAQAAKEWSDTLMKRERAIERAIERSEEPELLDGPPTTAQARITAYIPHHTTGELPIPKPFLFPRVEPKTAGSSMRHIVKPKPREIEL